MRMRKKYKQPRRLVAGMDRIRLQEPVDQFDNGPGFVARVVADLVMTRGDDPRGIVKPNFRRDRGPLAEHGPVWLTAPEGAYVFTESHEGPLVEVVREHGYLEVVDPAEAEILWRRLELVSGTSSLRDLLPRVESLQEARLHILRELFPEIPANLRDVRGVRGVADLPAETGSDPVPAGRGGLFEPWSSVLRLGPRKGTTVAVVTEAPAPGRRNTYALVARA